MVAHLGRLPDTLSQAQPQVTPAQCPSPCPSPSTALRPWEGPLMSLPFPVTNSPPPPKRQPFSSPLSPDVAFACSHTLYKESHTACSLVFGFLDLACESHLGCGLYIAVDSFFYCWIRFHYLFICSPVDGIWVVFCLELSWVKLQCAFMATSLCRHLLSLLLGQCLRVEWLGHRTGVRLTL